MLERKRIPIKQCPQCGWEAEGHPVEDPAASGGGALLKRVPPPPKFAYECGNCGQQWVE
ncbi:MAG TPA: hypothetical protein VGD06_16000 [Acidobacteriota bacterium]